MDSSFRFFWDTVLKSGLLNHEEAKALHAACLRPVAPPSGDEAMIQRFAGLARERDLLTPWQIKKLLEGRFKGFYLGEYVLLDYLGEVEGTATRAYLARQTVSPFLEVVFEITKPQDTSPRDVDPVIRYVKRSRYTPE